MRRGKREKTGGEKGRREAGVKLLGDVFRRRKNTRKR